MNITIKDIITNNIRSLGKNDLENYNRDNKCYKECRYKFNYIIKSQKIFNIKIKHIENENELNKIYMNKL